MAIAAPSPAGRPPDASFAAAFRRLCFGAAAAAQTPPAPPAPATVRVLMRTSAGDITMAIETQRAPITAANFLRYVDARRLDGTEFYRAMQATRPARA